MAYQQDIAFQAKPSQYQYDPSRMSELLDAMRRNADASNASQVQTQGTNLNNEYLQKTMDPRVAEALSKAQEMALANRKTGLEMPELEIGARKAGIQGQYLDANGVPGLPPSLQGQAQPVQGAPNLPPPLSQGPQRPQQAAPVMPPILAKFQGMSLNELRQAKMQDQQSGGALGQFIDPVLGMKMQTEKQAMYDDLASPEWKARIAGDPKKEIAGIGTKNTNASVLFNEFRKNHPVISLLPETEQAKIQTESFKANAQPNMAVVNSTPPPAKVIDNAIRRVAAGESTVSEEINKGRFAGAQAMEIHDRLVEGVKAMKPDFSEADDEAGYAYSKSPKVKTALTQMDNAYTTVGRLQKIFAKLDNGQFPTLNAAFNAGKFQAGDVAAARASIGKILGNDELSKAFAGGGVTSDKLRDMSDALVNKNLSPGQMKAQFDELLQGIARQRAAYETQGAGHIKPMKAMESAPKAHPQDSQAVEWAKANPKDPRAAKILQANGMQ
jgi:hypothetical protein